MAEADLQRFLRKVEQLNAFVALSEANPELRRQLRDCSHHNAVVELARRCGFEIGRRWGEPAPGDAEPGAAGKQADAPPGPPTPPTCSPRTARRPARRSPRCCSRGRAGGWSGSTPARPAARRASGTTRASTSGSPCCRAAPCCSSPMKPHRARSAVGMAC
ncbi:Nif11-like leader peptide family natural product precursor [Synechococcus sp. GFB01]|uniref:Nif11-like leader peptide family natural product precursor n=1 Tax=Synechococcus sp. GFB01 TaxID=1662190 RepID=UPI000AC587FC|nr:Nif11-like leader peptide family natural product precursor [Synechococcus sp. GFB01]